MKRSVNFRGSAPAPASVAPGYRSRLPCGCEIRLGMESASLAQCPPHTATAELLAACKAMLSRLPTLWGDNVHDSMISLDLDEEAVDSALAAIAKAEGHR